MEVAGFDRTFVIDQGTVLGMDQLFAALYNKPLNDPKRDGICTGLSMIWLARRYMFHDETPDQRKRALNSTGGYRWGGKTQDLHLVSGTAGAGLDAQLATMYADALKAYSLRIVAGSLVSSFSSDAATIAKALAASAKEKHAYRLWNLGLTTPTGDAGHMVASYASGGTLGFARHLYLFDPNMAEFRLPLGDTEKFIKAFVESYAAAFTGVRYFVSFAVQR